MNPEVFNTVTERVGRFLAIADAVAGADFDSISMDLTIRSKAHPSLMGICQEGSNVYLEDEDMEHMINGETSPVTPQMVLQEISKYETMKKHDEYIANLVDSIAKNGGAFIESISVDDLHTLQAIWSDAYGEDRLELFMHKLNANMLRGYARTSLSPAQIKERQNEDGPEIKCDPLFKNAVPMFCVKK